MSQKFTKILGLVALSGLVSITEAQTINWAPAGPVYTAGRARNIIVDNTDPSGKTMYVGSASSGIFKTTDAGANWTPINDQSSVRNISYLAQAKDGTIYAATGEGFLRFGQKLKAEQGTGLYKLTGSSLNTLTQVAPASVVGNVINRVACDPSNAARIAIATNKGILISSDGGNSFTPANGIPTNTLTSGQDVKFDNSGLLYCSIGSELAYLSYNTVASKVYRSDDNSLSNFSNKTPTSSILTDSNYGRIELAISSSSNNVVYASCANKSTANPTTNILGAESSASLKAIFVSYDAGQNWALLLQGSSQIDPLSNGGTIASGDYAHVIVVSPTNPNVLYIGGYSFYIFQRTGGSNSAPLGNWIQLGESYYKNIPYYLHENIHDIKIIPGSPEKIYFVTDAGIYRTIDLTQTNVSFQPFYKGLATGQFNSVSIERYPLTALPVPTAPGASVTPYIGFIGGTGGTGMTYFSGTYSNVTQESSYLSGEVYNTEYSKILPEAAFLSRGSGAVYRTSNAQNSNPALVKVNAYTGILSKIAPSPSDFQNTGYNSGTPFKLWENYGQRQVPPDSAMFYNDSLRFQASMGSVSTLTTQATFTFSAARPNRFALIDSIVIRTATVTLPISNPPPINPPFTSADRKDITLKLNDNYVVTGSVTTIPSSSISATGGISTSSGPTVTLNSATLLDEISVTFNAPPFLTKTVSTIPGVTNPADFYRVFATVFYKYKAGDSVAVVDNNISTKSIEYKTALTQPLKWAYGAFPGYTFSANTNSAVSNPTFVLNPGNVSQSSNVFVVRPIGPTNYTVVEYGTYSLSAIPVVYTLSALTDTTIPTGTSYTFVLNPGAITQTAVPTKSLVTFTVIPSATTVYTVTQTGTAVATADTQFTVVATSYQLYPDSIYQSSSLFLVTPTSPKTYTIRGVSSNTAIGANTSVTYNQTSTTFSAGPVFVPFPKKNPLVKVPMFMSARLALILNNSGNTGSRNAVVVSKNPLSLNDPLNLVRVSQSGCMTDDILGNASTNTISIPGKPLMLEWSKSGTELYYATSDNKLYRVSHITTIMDQSASSYSGKFYTDIFEYNNVPQHGILASPVNYRSPYRTTLVGDFGTNTISSISVSNDDMNIAVTFNSASSGTAVVYNSGDIRKGNNTNIQWNNKSTGLPASLNIYCSLMEKGDNKKVFIGTDNGIYYTNDIVAGTAWVNSESLSDADSKLPNVQVFDIEQQTMAPWDCYNSGQIYVATNGRGIWVTGTYSVPYVVSVEEIQKDKTDNSLSIYPNPANGRVTVEFNGESAGTAHLNIMDISGRIVKSENLGKLEPGDVNYSFDVSSLNSGIYIINITGESGFKKISKLIVTK